MATHLRDTLSLLVSNDAKPQATRILARLAANAAARGGAVFREELDELIVFASCDTTVSGLGRAESVWRAGAQQVERGPAFMRGGDSFYPLDCGPDTRGFLFIEAGALSNDDVSAPWLMALGATVAEAIAQSASPALVLKETHEQMVRRVLRETEWNLSLASRRFKKSRRTVYLWMERYGILRPVKTGRGERLTAAPQS